MVHCRRHLEVLHHLRLLHRLRRLARWTHHLVVVVVLVKEYHHLAHCLWVAPVALVALKALAVPDPVEDSTPECLVLRKSEARWL